MTKAIDKHYRLIPMDEITEDAREIAKRWYDGVSELNDIREKHKLASDIQNYAEIISNLRIKREGIGFGKWLSLNYYLDDGGFYHHDYQNKTRFTIEELYELYIQSKK